MKAILKTRESINGILVIYLSGDKAKSQYFSYEKLIKMEINAGDLLNNPEYYGMTEDESGIERTDFCRPELHEKPVR